MKAIAKLRPEPGAMALIDVPPPVRRPGEVLIRISAGGICGTDVAIWKWYEAVVGQYAPDFPLIVGHEFAGTVVESDSPRVQHGAVVAVNPQIACGHCYFCSLGRPTLCDDRKLMGGRINIFAKKGEVGDLAPGGLFSRYRPIRRTRDMIVHPRITFRVLVVVGLLGLAGVILPSVGSEPGFPDVTPRDAKALREWDAAHSGAAV